MSVHGRSHDTFFLINYSKFIIMTSNEHIVALEHKQDIREEVVREKENKKVGLKIIRDRMI